MQVFDDPLDDKECYPKIDAFMRALQDPGSSSSSSAKQKKPGGTRTASSDAASSCDTVIVYPKLMKVMASVQKTLHSKYSHVGMPKHPTDCKRQLVLACVRTRKSRDKGVVPDEFRQYAVEGSDTLFIINHNLDNGGFNIPLSACLEHWRSQKKKDFDSRTPNDACRVAAILLLPEFRDLVAKILSEKKDRAMMDQASCPVSAFYEVAAEKYRDPLFVARTPDKFELIDGHEHIDPNDEDRIMLEGRNGVWFKASWESYLRLKYRKTLARWWSDTGGGGGQLENFQNYCLFREKWLTYVYMLDFEASLLLASNASSAVPQELLNESGNHVQAHREPTGNGNKTSFAKLNSAALVQATEECTNNINKVASLMATLVEKRLSPAASNVVMSTPTTMSSTLLQQRSAV
jgi:hypothetical protein